MVIRRLRNLANYLAGTPLHPQWLMQGDKERFLNSISESLQGRILDVGCADKASRNYMSQYVQYIGVDYVTANTLYNSKPDIYANAEKLPFESNSIDVVLLLDVLEHIQDADKCMYEVKRVLKMNGRLVLNVPFIYPVHDAPDDYYRWSEFGLRTLLKKYGMSIEYYDAYGNPLVTSGLLLNIALCKSVINSLEKRHPAMIFFIFLPVLIPLINIIAHLSGLLFPSDSFMPYRYHIIATKETSG